MYQNFIGIDIGKDNFAMAIHGQSKVVFYTNTTKGFRELNKDCNKILKNTLVILETTGGYEMALIRFLQKKNIAVHRANTRKVKHFIRSFGQLGKSDSIDALALANYGIERQATLPLFVETPEKQLLKLVNRRTELKQMVVKEKNRLQAPEQSDLKASFMAVIKALEKQVSIVDDAIEEIYINNPILSQQKEILKTIPGIGEITAKQLLAIMPELGLANRKQIASLGGVAPHPNESGRKVGYRSTRGGRADVKPVLFIAAMSASRSRSSLGDFYKKLLEAGKKKMVALTALMRKILVIANAKMRDFYAENAAATT